MNRLPLFSSLLTFIDFDDANWLYLSGSATHYKFDHHYNGMLRTDDRVTPLSYDNIERLGKYRGNLLYRHSFSKTSLLDVKARYFDYSSDYKSEIDSRSKMREGSGEILYQRRAIDLWENPLDLTFDYKGIYRKNFTGKEREWLSTQWIHAVNASASYGVGNLSGYLSLSYDYMHQKLEGGTSIDRHSVLPVASLLYKNPTLFDLSANYSRKITRPSIDYLNPEAYVFSPLYIRTGNPGLDTQVNNEVSLRVSRSLPHQHTLSLNGYHLFNNKVIGEVICEEGDRTFYSYDNIGKMCVSGVSLSWFASLPKSFYLNVMLGPSHHKYAAPSGTALVRENGGWSFMSYLGVGTTIKDFLTIDLDYSHNSRMYQLVSTVKMRPMVNLNVEASLLKDKLKLGLYCMDLGGCSTTTRSSVCGESFEQDAVTRNKVMNFTFSVRYLFGKKFSNNGSTGSVIDNSDIITK
ncbi:outer membrane beta-barrel protein [Parabacteroides distasonis]|nr:outer membrane beta-barrel protein [Parabacteroides distasonis]